VQEAYYIFQELCEKYTWTVMLMNGSAVCQMHMGHFDEAETRLLEALNKVCFSFTFKFATDIRRVSGYLEEADLCKLA
jgi:hypothetical protein